MSFMFKPLTYDDPNAVNYPILTKEIKNSITFGTTNSAVKIAAFIRKKLEESRGKGIAVALDGYASADFSSLMGAITQSLRQDGILIAIKEMKDIYLSIEELDKKLIDSLPQNLDEDPVLLFGRRFGGTFSDLFDKKAVEETVRKISNVIDNMVFFLVGYGSASEAFRNILDFVVYIDVTPKTAAIRARNGQLINIGDRTPRRFSELMRRNYYVDFEVILDSRKHLLRTNRIDFYICGDKQDDFILMDGETLSEILETLLKSPYRCMPVYLEGIWGGEFVRKVRKLPKEYNNIAWVFDMIPMEVSVAVDVDGKTIVFPHFTVIQKYPELLMGEKCAEVFGGYFPIRFNYDDTYHSGGNMSIQVHPGETYCMDKYNELGRQDEAYYVIATGHGAKTFVGLTETANSKEFVELAKNSEKTGIDIDYEKYINAIESKPGVQIMLPGGTIHASGRNQLILELGSLTVGSYTYKMYDYNRVDREGNLRPIHSKCGEAVLRFDRTTDWVKENIVMKPKLIEKGSGYKVYLIGNTELMYFQTYSIELDIGGQVEMCSNDQFTVLTMVDGEDALIYSKQNPKFCYDQKFLDIIIVPATIDVFVIKNTGYQPCVIHKTVLKEGYQRFLDPQKN